jgi:hypothetical protein
MYVPVTVFTDKDDKRKETSNDATKHHHHKEEPNISKSMVQNSEVDLDKKV